MHTGQCARQSLIIHLCRNWLAGPAGCLDRGFALTGLLRHNQQIQRTLHAMTRNKSNKFRASRCMPDAERFKSATWNQRRALLVRKPTPRCARMTHIFRGSVPGKCFAGRLRPFIGQRCVSTAVVYKGATRHPMRLYGAECSVDCLQGYPLLHQFRYSKSAAYIQFR